MYSGYALFVLLGMYRAIFSHDFTDAAATLGIALIFDLFAPTPWQDRRLWQKMLLAAHVTAMLGMFIAGLL